jgi:tRNA G18 (ribose-2'-O)-methylase SpoU
VTSALILHNIRSVYNVGSIFRTADAAGVSKIILSGYTPAPIDRFNQPRKDFSKVSLGAEKAVAWESARTLASAIKKLKREGFYIAAIEQDESSTPLFAFKAPEKIALVLGNEVRGVSAASLKLCDAVLEIPMHGMKESLNVSVAAGIAMFTILAK